MTHSLLELEQPALPSLNQPILKTWSETEPKPTPDEFKASMAELLLTAAGRGWTSVRMYLTTFDCPESVAWHWIAHGVTRAAGIRFHSRRCGVGPWAEFVVVRGES